jgi:hypothetical protein
MGFLRRSIAVDLSICSVSVSALQGVVSTGEFFQPSGSSLDFGIRAAYRF